MNGTVNILDAKNHLLRTWSALTRAMSGVNLHPRGWLVDNARKVVTAGSARSVILKREGKVVVEVQLTTSLIGLLSAMVLAPELTAATAILGLLTSCTVEVRRPPIHPL